MHRAKIIKTKPKKCVSVQIPMDLNLEERKLLPLALAFLHMYLKVFLFQTAKFEWEIV